MWDHNDHAIPSIDFEACIREALRELFKDLHTLGDAMDPSYYDHTVRSVRIEIRMIYSRLEAIKIVRGLESLMRQLEYYFAVWGRVISRRQPDLGTTFMVTDWPSRQGMHVP